MPCRVFTRQTTAKRFHPQPVRTQNASRLRALLPRIGRIPHQTIVAESNQERAVRVMAGPHMGDGQQALPRVRGDLKRPRTQDKKWTTINEGDDDSKRRRRRQRKRQSNSPPSADHQHASLLLMSCKRLCFRYTSCPWAGKNQRE